MLTCLYSAAPRCSRRLALLKSTRYASTAVDAASSDLEGAELNQQEEFDWPGLQRERAFKKMLIHHMSDFGSTQNRETTFQPHHPLHRPPSPAKTTLSALLAAGAHMGHSRSLLNPNFMPYVYGVRAGIHIIDLDHTLPLLRRAANLTRAIAYRKGSILFVGTRPDLRIVVQKAAERLGPTQGFFVGERWLPGTLTNRLQLFGPEVVKEQKVIPDLVVLLNPLANINAIRECAISHVPTIGIVDTNVDPRVVMYPIPANDESPRTAELIAGMLSIAGKEGIAMRAADDDRSAKQRKQEDDRREEKAKKFNGYSIYGGLNRHARPRA